MSLIGCLLICAVTLCCSAQSDSDSCGKPSGEREMELQGTWDKDSFPSGSIVTFLCRPGYSRLGVIKKECKGGQWKYITTGKCAKKPCGHPGDIPFGSFELKEENEFVFGAVVVYQCDTGYQLVSKLNTRTCTATGWSNYAPTCEEITCQPEYVRNGKIRNPKNIYKVGEIADVECEYGYILEIKPEEPRKCTTSGWSLPLNCVSVRCNNPHLENGYLYYNYWFPLRQNQKLHYYCNDNYVPLYKEYERSSYGTSTCTDNGWDPKPKCIASPCGRPPYVQYATVLKEKAQYKSGDTATYVCIEGYALSDEGIPCCIAGEWTNIPKCTSTSCVSPPTISNARLTTTKINYKSGGKANYQCDKGFVFANTNYALCENTLWKQVPECRRENANCGHAPVVQYGDTIQDRKPIHTHGTVITYQCPDYYLLEGNKNIKCIHGKWDEPPVCIEPCTITKKGMAANNLALRWEYKDKLYVKHEEWIEFVCLTGYEDISQSLRIQCNRSVVPYPKCFKKGACIVSPIEMERNNISAIGGTEYESGKTVTFQCIEGFIPEKELTSVCKNKKINYPTCINA
ncbi:hypothetical protein GDO86_007598, partial [Hymenochirus boettgeri]